MNHSPGEVKSTSQEATHAATLTFDRLAVGPYTTDVIAQYTLTWQNWDIYIEALSETQRDWLETKYALSLDQWRFAVDKASTGESAPFPLLSSLRRNGARRRVTTGVRFLTRPARPKPRSGKHWRPQWIRKDSPQTSTVGP